MWQNVRAPQCLGPKLLRPEAKSVIAREEISEFVRSKLAIESTRSVYTLISDIDKLTERSVASRHN